MDLLNLLILIPVLTLIAILFAKDGSQAKKVAAGGMVVQLVVIGVLVYQYYSMRLQGITDHVLFSADYMWFESLNIRYSIGIDGISLAMIMLTGLVIFAGVFSSWEVKEQPKEFFIWLVLLATGVFGFFISLDLFVMFLFFELAVIPMYLLIGVWGSGPKEYAAMKLTLMLMGASALLLVGIFGIYFNSNADGTGFTFHINEIADKGLSIRAQQLFFPLTFIGFGVIGALFPFHTWSPDGHSSAPTAVSMLHAGVLMKLGGYGCLKVAVYLMPEAAQMQSDFFLILATIGVIYGALGTLMQKDLKYINAYSSVSHCGLVLFGVLMLNRTAFDGAVLQMVSHGLMTALFFALIGMIYSRTHTRLVNEMKGLMKVLPFISTAYVIAGLTSLGLPGLSGFVAESTIFVGGFQNPDLFRKVLTIIAVSSIVVAAVYILRVVGQIIMGSMKSDEYLSFSKATWFEKTSAITLMIAIILMGISPLWLSELILEGVEPIMLKIESLKF